MAWIGQIGPAPQLDAAMVATKLDRLGRPGTSPESQPSFWVVAVLLAGVGEGAGAQCRLGG
ncbi:hypothetical protein GCM10027569_87190 [Flindersiella endophytica]